MITPISLSEYAITVKAALEEQEHECDECEGTGFCCCCSRVCQECDGDGQIMKVLTDREVHAMYFMAVMQSLKKLCAYSSRHDFLTEAGDFIKANGRPDTRLDWLKANGCSEAPYINQPNLNTVH